MCDSFNKAQDIVNILEQEHKEMEKNTSLSACKM